jgi:two-component system, LytTR family, sensor kinase
MEQTAPLKLNISARVHANDLYVEVANSGHWPATHAQGTNGNGLGIGLRNIKERLAQLYPGQSRFEIGEKDGWVRAVIEIKKR